MRRNKVLGAFFQLDGVFSSVVDGLVRWGWFGSKAFAKALNLSTLILEFGVVRCASTWYAGAAVATAAWFRFGEATMKTDGGMVLVWRGNYGCGGVLW